MPVVDILHIDLAVPPTLQRSEASECLIVFWWTDVPVGQIRHAAKRHEPLSLTALAAEAVDATVLKSAQELCAREAALQVVPNGPISAIICTRDRPEEIARCLASFADQTLTPSEIVVVDNASQDDRTRDVALAAGATYVRENRPGLDFARNAGALAASGEILVYTDDDVRLHPRWLERMVRPFEDPQVMGVTGLVLPAELDTEAQLHFEEFWSFGRGYRSIDFTSNNRPWEIGAGASMAFRRTVFDLVGLFDERLDVGQAGCSGDSEYWHRVLTHGWICHYEPTAVVFHFHRRTWEGLSRQLYSYARGHSAALLVQYERSREKQNLHAAFIAVPCWYAARILHGSLRGWEERDRFLRQEIQGFLSGLRFYWQNRKLGQRECRSFDTP